MTDALAARPGVVAGILRVLAIVLIFAALGPPIGGVTLITLMAIVNMGSGTSPSDYVTVVMFALIYGTMFAYLVGLAPSAAVGLTVAIRQVYFGRVTWLAALGIGCIAGLIVIYLVEHEPGYDGNYPVSMRPLLVLTCVLPTMVCWLIVRRWHRRPQAVAV